MQVKARVITVVFVWFAGSIFVQGCAMDHRAPVVSSEKVLVMDLNKYPEYQELLVGKPQTCGMRSGRVYLRPGETCGQHSTKAHEEMLTFLSGKGTALIGEEETTFELGEGKVFYIPPHTTHNIKNTGTEPLIYIYCVAPVNSLN
jgi:quercetin dioxygenase-like cupin family protein